jgi:hypothetical protein
MSATWLCRKKYLFLTVWFTLISMNIFIFVCNINVQFTYIGYTCMMKLTLFVLCKAGEQYFWLSADWGTNGIGWREYWKDEVSTNYSANTHKAHETKWLWSLNIGHCRANAVIL